MDMLLGILFGVMVAMGMQAWRPMRPHERAQLLRFLADDAAAGVTHDGAAAPFADKLHSVVARMNAQHTLPTRDRAVIARAAVAALVRLGNVADRFVNFPDTPDKPKRR